MSKPSSSSSRTSSSRRDFLRAGATLLGGSALGVLPALAAAEQISSGTKGAVQAKGVAVAAKLAPTVSYWDGARFVPAESLRAGDATFGAVRLTLTSVGTGGLDAIDAYAPVPGVAPVPFGIWVARPAGVARAVSTVALDPDGGISLTLRLGRESATLRLTNGGGAGAKLRPGTYVIAGSAVDLRGATLDASGALSSRTALAATHVVVTVEAA